MRNNYPFIGRSIMALAAVVGFLLYGRSRASAADRKRIKKYRGLPQTKFRLGFSFWGYELRAISIDDSATEEDALAVAKYFWFVHGVLRPDCGEHAAIVFRDAQGRPLTRVGMARPETGAEYKRTLFVFGDPHRPVKPMKFVPIEEVRDLEPVDGKSVI